MIAVIGGTGKLGQGLAMRWALVGEEVVLGSRSIEKAQRVKLELSEKTGKKIRGATNLDAVYQADFIVFSIPFEGIGKIVDEIRPALSSEKTIISAIVPLKLEKNMLVCYTPPASSAAEEVARLVGGKINVCSALHTVGAQQLHRVGEAMKGDIVVCGDNARAKQVTMKYIERITELSAVDGGPLCNSRLIEPVAALLVELTHIHKVPGVGISFSGLEKIKKLKSPRTTRAMKRRGLHEER